MCPTTVYSFSRIHPCCTIGWKFGSPLGLQVELDCCQSLSASRSWARRVGRACELTSAQHQYIRLSAHANFHSALQSQNNTSNMHPATCLPAPADFDSRPLFSRRRLSGPASATPCRMGSQMKATAMYVPALQALVVLRLVALVLHSTCGLRHKLHHKK